MTTSTHREAASFPIEPGASRDDLVNGFMEATREIQTRATDQNATVLWDMARFEYVEEERDEAWNIVGDVAYQSTWPARLIVSAPVVVTK